MSDLRHLPTVDKLLSQAAPLIDAYGRSLTTDAIRSVLDDARSAIRSGGAPPDQSELLSRTAERLRHWTQPRPRSVINATGVIIHTNLGRAPLSSEALPAVTTAASSYSDLEFDLERGERGQRMAAVEDALKRVTGAEDAFSIDIVGDVDDIFYDRTTKRLYASCVEGFLCVIQQIDPDHYSALARIPTAKGAQHLALRFGIQTVVSCSPAP